MKEPGKMFETRFDETKVPDIVRDYAARQLEGVIIPPGQHAIVKVPFDDYLWVQAYAPSGLVGEWLGRALAWAFLSQEEQYGRLGLRSRE